MIWQDLVLERKVDNRKMAETLARVFDVDPRAVLVVERLNPDLDPAGVTILADRLSCKGQFASRFRIAIRDDDLWTRIEPFEQKIKTVQRLCEILETSCLIGGSEADPFTDLLVRPTGEITEVELDDDSADDEFVVLSSKAPKGQAA